MKKAKVSVIVPAFNEEKTIAGCIESLLVQSYPDFEMIVVNDGSTDKTSLVVERYQAGDSRLKLLCQQNQGLSGARNTGLDHAAGDFICMVDADDRVEADFLEVMLQQMEEGVDIAVCGMIKTRLDGSTLEMLPACRTVTGEQASLYLLEGRDFTGFVTNKMFRASLFKTQRIRFPTGLIYEDIITSYQCCQHADKVRYLDKVLYHYQKKENSICTNYNTPKRMEDFITVIERMLALTPVDPRYMKAFLLFLYDALVRLNRYYIRSDYPHGDEVFKRCSGTILGHIQRIKQAGGQQASGSSAEHPAQQRH